MKMLPLVKGFKQVLCTVGKVVLVIRKPDVSTPVNQNLVIEWSPEIMKRNSMNWNWKRIGVAE
jgi:hypothetical protein